MNTLTFHLKASSNIFIWKRLNSTNYIQRYQFPGTWVFRNDQQIDEKYKSALVQKMFSNKTGQIFVDTVKCFIDKFKYI